MDKPKWKKPNEKYTHHIFSCIWNVQKRQNYRNKNKSAVAKGWEWKQGKTANKHEGTSYDNWNVLKVDSVNLHNSMYVLIITELYTLTKSEFCEVQTMS